MLSTETHLLAWALPSPVLPPAPRRAPAEVAVAEVDVPDTVPPVFEHAFQVRSVEELLARVSSVFERVAGGWPRAGVCAAALDYLTRVGADMNPNKEPARVFHGGAIHAIDAAGLLFSCEGFSGVGGV